MDVYEISSEDETLHGVGLRFRLRVVGAENNIPLTAENIPGNRVRITVPEGADITAIKEMLKEFRPLAEVKKID